ncbi:splicing factor 3B subunit 1 [Angomonas deanei]|nr:splicing factor 3B subunit 1 [Angomonas deanei]|eukprot:EPY27980.1 splicing factor 3B subunit 1 [Angomonas deanei]
MPQMKPKDAEAFVELLRFHNVDPIPDEYLPSYILTKQLFKIKNGTNIQRRAGTRYLLDKSNVFGVRFITEKMFRIWSKNVLDPQEVHYFVEFIKLLIVHVGQGIRDSVKEIIHMVQPLLSTKESLIVREDGKQVLTLMARVVGFDVIFAAVKEDCSAGESVIRRHAALVIAICGYASGGEEMMRTLTEISNIPHPHVQQTVCVALAEMAPLFGHATISFLPEIVPVLARLLQEDRKVRVDSARAVSAIAEACAPYGIEELEPLVSIICDECKRGLGTNARYFLQAFGSLVSLMSPHDAQRYTQDMMNVLVSQFNRPEDEFRRVMLMVVRRCIASDGVTADFIRDVMLDSYFEGFWGVQRLATNRRTAAALVITTVEIAKKVGGDEVLSRLTPMMKHENEEYQRMVVNTVRAVVDNEGLDNSPHGLLVSLLDGGMTALRQDTMGTSSAVKDCLASICIALGKRLNKFLPQVLDLINSRRESKEPGQRSQAVNLVTRIAPTIMEADGAIFLSELGRSIYERMEDDDPHVMAACIRASEAILAELGGAKYRPSVKELLKRLTHVISNQHNIVQQNCISLIELVVTRHDQEVDPIDLHKLATEGLFKLLDADRRKTRQTCARVFGKVAESIRPFAIILELVDNFRQDKRKVRVCTAIALASIAKACGPFTVLPYLLNEYKLSEGEQVAVIIQHSVLKAIRYIFEFIGAVGKEYVYPLLPLLERALTENSIQMRRMATEASIAIVLALSGNDGFEEVAIHLLNFIHPNIVELLSRKEARVGEERLKMVTAVVGYYEAIRTVLHPGQIMQYLYQGLFHPATKVRDIYRRTYNMIYMVSPQSLLPYYPRIKDTPQHVLTHHELEVLV